MDKWQQDGRFKGVHVSGRKALPPFLHHGQEKVLEQHQGTRTHFFKRLRGIWILVCLIWGRGSMILIAPSFLLLFLSRKIFINFPFYSWDSVHLHSTMTAPGQSACTLPLCPPSHSSRNGERAPWNFREN